MCYGKGIKFFERNLGLSSVPTHFSANFPTKIPYFPSLEMHVMVVIQILEI